MPIQQIQQNPYGVLPKIYQNFWFIRESGKVFIHINGVLEKIDENDKVTYELESGAKGMNAFQVKKV